MPDPQIPNSSYFFSSSHTYFLVYTKFYCGMHLLLNVRNELDLALFRPELDSCIYNFSDYIFPIEKASMLMPQGKHMHRWDEGGGKNYTEEDPY